MLQKFLSVIPILIAVVTGYLTAVAVGIVDFTPVLEASFISIPNFQAPKFSMDAILMMLPVLLVIASEHIGHQIVTGEVVGRNLIEDPGLHRSLFADNFSTMISGLIGSVPTTTYGENIELWRLLAYIAYKLLPELPSYPSSVHSLVHYLH